MHFPTSGPDRDAAAARQFRKGILSLERKLERYAGPNLIGDPYRDDAQLARELKALHRVVVRATIHNRTIAEWILTSGAARYDILVSSPRPTEAALRAAKYSALFDWTDVAVVRPHLRGRYVPNVTDEMPRRAGEVVAMPTRDQRGVILSGASCYSFNSIDAKRSGIRLQQRVSFIARRIGTAEIATDIAVGSQQDRRRAA